MSTPALCCRDLEVRRASGFVLRVAELALDAGTTTAICGANGSGKSTLLLACAGLIDLSGGAIETDGALYHQGKAPAPSDMRRRVVLVTQDPYLLRGSVSRNLGWGLRLRRVPRSEQRGRISEVLGALGITALAEQEAASLSGGQRTLVAVARALVLRPALLLLDEVTRDLDREHRAAVVEAIKKSSVGGAAVMLATHDQGIVDELGASRIELNDGEIEG